MLETFRASLTDTATEGTFTAVASGADSIAMGERGPTRFEKGAFRESLTRKKQYPLLWQHKDAEVIGVSVFSEGSEGLMLDGKLALGTRRGAEAHELLKMGAVTEVSIGFTADKHRVEVQGGRSVRVVERATLAECSIVTFAADPAAKVRMVHSLDEEDFSELEGVIGDLKALESHEGKVFSSSNLARLKTAAEQLFDLISAVDPGSVAALGRKAARLMKKSLVVVSKKRNYRHNAALCLHRLRELELQAALLERQADLSDVPLLKTASDAYPTDGSVTPEASLQNAIYGACAFPEAAQRVLTAEAAKQYLLLIGEAEEVDEDEEESYATRDQREETAAAAPAATEAKQ